MPSLRKSIYHLPFRVYSRSLPRVDYAIAAVSTKDREDSLSPQMRLRWVETAFNIIWINSDEENVVYIPIMGVNNMFLVKIRAMAEVKFFGRSYFADYYFTKRDLTDTSFLAGFSYETGFSEFTLAPILACIKAHVDRAIAEARTTMLDLGRYTWVASENRGTIGWFNRPRHPTLDPLTPQHYKEPL